MIEKLKPCKVGIKKLNNGFFVEVNFQTNGIVYVISKGQNLKFELFL